MYIAAILTSNRTDCCLINFLFPSYAATSPMTIATVHSVHLPFSLNFIIYFLTICAAYNCPQHIINAQNMNFKLFPDTFP